MSPTHRPRLTVITEYELVAAGIAAFLARFEHQIELLDPRPIEHLGEVQADIALYDTFGRLGARADDLQALADQPGVAAVAVYSFNSEDQAVATALDSGASAHLSKAMDASQLTSELLRVAAGEQVVAGPTGVGRSTREERGWPGQDLGLSEREAEVTALAALGHRNADIAHALAVSIDTVKTHLARSFRKLDVHNRTELSALVHRRPSFRRLRAHVDA